MDEQDIWRTASVLIKRFGDDAPVHAALRADELSIDGDLDGQSAWLRVLAAIRELTNVTHRGSTH